MTPELEARHHADASGITLPYRIFTPPACGPERRCGLLVFLHGAGERGSDNRAQLGNDALAFVDSAVQSEFPTVVVYPQCPAHLQWVDAVWTSPSYVLARTPVSKAMTAVVGLLERLRQHPAVDPARVLVTGLSMGGFGTWDLVLRHPSWFAGALALCGGGDPTQASLIRTLPMWAFHGEQDAAVPVQASRRMVAALREVGGSPRYSEVAGVGHDVWTIAYRDPGVVRWLLSRRR